MTRPKHGRRNLHYCLSFRACERALGFDGSPPVARLHQDEVAIIRSSSPSRQLNGGEWRSNDNRMSVSKRSRNGRHDWANCTPVSSASAASAGKFRVGNAIVRGLRRPAASYRASLVSATMAKLFDLF